MTKKRDRKPLFFIAILLGVFLLSLLSSVMIFNQAAYQSKKETTYHMLFYMTQYEYELRQINLAITEVYYQKNEEWESFDKWFNILWSRVEGLYIGGLNKEIENKAFDLSSLKKNMAKIDEDLYVNRKTVNKKVIFEVKELLKKMTHDVHAFRLGKEFDKRLIWKNEKAFTFSSFKNSIIINMMTLLFCLFIIYSLYRNNKNLSNLQITLEKRVNSRTKKLLKSNLNLQKEIEERYLVENKLRKSYEEAKKISALVQNQANYDFLTQLANRNLLLERFSQALIRAKRENNKVALIFIDLDRFKYVNDTFGHSVGDSLLKEVAARLLYILRESDTASRLGGDEFAIILPDVKKEQEIEIVVQRILESLVKPFNLEGHEAFISASIGVTFFPEDGQDTETLLRKADTAMYKAKQKGRNNFQFFTNVMDLEIQHRRELETGLHKALEKEEFDIHYQAIVDINTNEITSAEALIRWKDPIKGYIPPGDFISLAEEIGLIVEIGEWALKTACKEAALWENLFIDAPKVAVNMSSRQFQLVDTALLVKEALEESNLKAERLILEITEGLLVNDDKKTLKQLNKIRKMGIDLSIDDFGTGYSSLSYLKKFPISKLKIDRSFIHDLDKKEENKALIKAIIAMANSLNLKTVAEGVETQAQKDFLQKYNCKYYQGYYYSKPLNKEDFMLLLEKNKIKK
ncbi:MAG: EAL domain-containing protein [Campylobacteraceae bacterium]|nr:EAL domain-containing protein [Campylobacteraceae bacterium]